MRRDDAKEKTFYLQIDLVIIVFNMLYLPKAKFTQTASSGSFRVGLRTWSIARYSIADCIAPFRRVEVVYLQGSKVHILKSIARS